MKRRIIPITVSIIIILSFLTACTRNLEVVSIEVEAGPTIPKEIKPSQISSIESTASSQSSEPEELAHPYERSLISSWTPDGKYFVCISHDSINLYNTDNELEKQSEFSPPEKMFTPINGIYFYYTMFGNSGFYLVKSPMYPDEGNYFLWKAGNEYVIPDFYYIDWEGNTILQHPELEIQTSEDGNNEYYIGNRKAEPVPMERYCELIDDDLFLFCFSEMPGSQEASYCINDNEYCVYYIPSQNKFIDLGWQKSGSHCPVKTPKGILWVSWQGKQPLLQLTNSQGTVPLFQDKDFTYFYANDEIVVFVLDEVRLELGEGYVSPIWYASLEDLQLKEVGTMCAFSPQYDTNTIQIIGSYIVYEKFEESVQGIFAYDTKTDILWKIQGDFYREMIKGARLKNGEMEVLFDKAVATKDKITFYPDEEYEVHWDSINPPKTHCVYFSEDHSSFTIKPYLGWED